MSRIEVRTWTVSRPVFSVRSLYQLQIIMQEYGHQNIDGKNSIRSNSLGIDDEAIIEDEESLKKNKKREKLPP